MVCCHIGVPTIILQSPYRPSLLVEDIPQLLCFFGVLLRVTPPLNVRTRCIVPYHRRRRRRRSAGRRRGERKS